MKYKIGTKVILLSKHGSYNELKNCYTYKSITALNQKYAYIVDINLNYYVIYDKPLDKSIAGDYFEESDIRPYLSYERKQKLLKINQTR